MSSDHSEEVASEAGDDVFRPGAAAGGPVRAGVSAAAAQPFTRTAPAEAVGFGRGPILRDARKHRYDVTAARSRGKVNWSATKVDRLDAVVAGDLLHAVHVMFGLHTEPEERIYAFDQALWYEHAVNGGSTLQANRGSIVVDVTSFDIAEIVTKLGVDVRRFFRAYADDIADCLRATIAAYDPYDPEAAEKHAAIMQVAVARGLQKYPHLIHDSSDAGVRMSIEERAAVLASKRYVIAAAVNSADGFVGRVGQAAGVSSPAAVQGAAVTGSN